MHVWQARLGRGEQNRADAERILSADELERARRFYFERDRGSFIERRSILRRLLAVYLDVEPTELRFQYGEFGKPSFEGSAGALSFNQSHSGDVATIAISRDRDVGIDVQLIDVAVATDEVARRFFSVAEIAELQTLPDSRRVAAFFTCWARKEAYIKARGLGLSLPLDSFDVVPLEGRSSVLIDAREGAATSAWKIEDLQVDTSYSAAVSAMGADWKIISRRWPSDFSA